VSKNAKTMPQIAIISGGLAVSYTPFTVFRPTLSTSLTEPPIRAPPLHSVYRDTTSLVQFTKHAPKVITGRPHRLRPQRPPRAGPDRCLRVAAAHAASTTKESPFLTSPARSWAASSMVIPRDITFLHCESTEALSEMSC
jgi:hypothetical protein